MAPIMPYQFPEHLSGGMSWAFPALVVFVGFFMNWRYAGRLPLVLGWVIGFALQGVLRCLTNDLPLIVGLVPMTGVSFILFTFYMVTDPGSTPTNWREQVIFGVAIALVYSLLVLAHVGSHLLAYLLCFDRGLLLIQDWR